MPKRPHNLIEIPSDPKMSSSSAKEAKRSMAQASLNQENEFHKFPLLNSFPSLPFALNVQEMRLFEAILELCKERQLTTTVRAAGGWVRDKVEPFFAGFVFF